VLHHYIIYIWNFNPSSHSPTLNPLLNEIVFCIKFNHLYLFSFSLSLSLFHMHTIPHPLFSFYDKIVFIVNFYSYYILLYLFIWLIHYFMVISIACIYSISSKRKRAEYTMEIDFPKNFFIFYDQVPPKIFSSPIVKTPRRRRWRRLSKTPTTESRRPLFVLKKQFL